MQRFSGSLKPFYSRIFANNAAEIYFATKQANVFTIRYTGYLKTICIKAPGSLKPFITVCASQNLPYENLVSQVNPLPVAHRRGGWPYRHCADTVAAHGATFGVWLSVACRVVVPSDGGREHTIAALDSAAVVWRLGGCGLGDAAPAGLAFGLD